MTEETNRVAWVDTQVFCFEFTSEEVVLGPSVKRKGIFFTDREGKVAEIRIGNKNEFDTWFEKLLSELKRNGYSIKHITTLDRAIYSENYKYHYASHVSNNAGYGYGYGYGWGVTVPHLCYVVAERTEYVTQAEFERRQRLREREDIANRNAKRDEEIAEFEKAKQEKEQEKKSVENEKITKNQKFFKETFVFMQREFATQSSAEQVKREKIEHLESEIADLDKKISDKRAEMEALPPAPDAER